MADKVKLTPPMTDSKTPEWAVTEAEKAIEGTMATASPLFIDRISQALLSAYESGRADAVEALPDEIDLYQMLEREGLRKRADIARYLATAIRQLSRRADLPAPPAEENDNER